MHVHNLIFLESIEHKILGKKTLDKWQQRKKKKMIESKFETQPLKQHIFGLFRTSCSQASDNWYDHYNPYFFFLWITSNLKRLIIIFEFVYQDVSRKDHRKLPRQKLFYQCLSFPTRVCTKELQYSTVLLVKGS